MPFTREFKTTIQARVQRDPAFLRALQQHAGLRIEVKVKKAS